MLSIQAALNMFVAITAYVTILSALIFAALSWLFNSRFFRENIEGIKKNWRRLAQDNLVARKRILFLTGVFLLSKSTWAFVFSLIVAAQIEFDVLALIAGDENASTFGIFLSASILAGGSRSVLRLVKAGQDALLKREA